MGCQGGARRDERYPSAASTDAIDGGRGRGGARCTRSRHRSRRRKEGERVSSEYLISIRCFKHLHIPGIVFITSGKLSAYQIKIQKDQQRRFGNNLSSWYLI